MIITHGPLSNGLKESAEIIAGNIDDIFTLSLNPGNDIISFEASIRQKIKAYSQSNDVLVLTDIPGGSPSNVSAMSLQDLNFECLTGVNLPMVLEAVVSKDTAQDFQQFVNNVMLAGINGIKNLRKEFETN